jgi:hypothetical protein
LSWPGNGWRGEIIKSRDGTHNSQTNRVFVIGGDENSLKAGDRCLVPLDRYAPFDSVGLPNARRPSKSRNWRFDAAVSSHKQRVPRHAHLFDVV